MKCKHSKKVCGKTPKELARLVASLHYEALLKFYKELSDCLNEDCIADFHRGRTRLAGSLMEASDRTMAVTHSIKRAWEISKPFMK